MQEMDCACRLVFQLEGGGTIGHIAMVTNIDPERGIYAELLTLPARPANFLRCWRKFRE